jgi:mannosyl-3-phosphoglycerate phosphatase
MSAKSNKGSAVAHLTTLFRQKWGDIVTLGLGDSANDAPLLAAVERPFLVQKPGGHWQDMGNLPVIKVPATGPVGWRLVVEPFLE